MNVWTGTPVTAVMMTGAVLMAVAADLWGDVGFGMFMGAGVIAMMLFVTDALKPSWESLKLRVNERLDSWFKARQSRHCSPCHCDTLNERRRESENRGC